MNISKKIHLNEESRKEFEEAQLVINDFSEIDMQQLVELYKKE